MLKKLVKIGRPQSPLRVTLSRKKETYYFLTFTCYKWLPLFEIANIYDYLPFWFEKLKEKGVQLVGYVIMPNHLHLILYVESKSESLNQALAESKRFLAYEIIKRLKASKNNELIQTLKEGVQPNKRVKGKKHQIFRLSLDAKEISEDRKPSESSSSDSE
jgi:REP element-mobilizing transposase RayT